MSFTAVRREVVTPHKEVRIQQNKWRPPERERLENNYASLQTPRNNYWSKWGDTVYIIVFITFDFCIPLRGLFNTKLDD